MELLSSNLALAVTLTLKGGFTCIPVGMIKQEKPSVLCTERDCLKSASCTAVHKSLIRRALTYNGIYVAGAHEPPKAAKERLTSKDVSYYLTPFGLYRIWKTFVVPPKSASSSTTMAAQRPICISHLLSWVSHKSLQLRT